MVTGGGRASNMQLGGEEMTRVDRTGEEESRKELFTNGGCVTSVREGGSHGGGGGG